MKGKKEKDLEFYLVLRREDGVEYLWPARMLPVDGQPQMKELKVSSKAEPQVRK